MAFLQAHPQASNKEVSEALAKKKIMVSPNHVANIKTATKKGTAPTAPKKEKAPKAEKTPKPVTGFSEVVAILQEVSQFQDAHNGQGGEVISEVRELVTKAGGWDRLEEAMVAASQLAGAPAPKKFVKGKGQAITAQN